VVAQSRIIAWESQIDFDSTLRSADGAWITDAKEKAYLFKEAWQSKFVLPPLSSEDLFFIDPGPIHQHVIYLNTRVCERLLKRFKNQTSTGPDGLPVKF